MTSVNRILLLITIFLSPFDVHHLLHKSDIVVFGDVPVFQKIWPLVLGHRVEKVLDEFVGDKRMSEIQLCDVGLRYNVSYAMFFCWMASE
jgi:hypothetical protein